LALWWLAEQQLPSLSLRLSLVDEAGQSFRLIQGQPVYDTYPFDQWPSPSFVIDRQQFRVPEDLPGGEYFYRLEVRDGQDQTIYGTDDLGSVTVTQTERVFDLPPFDFPVGASFDGEIALPGYNLSTSFGLHSLELIWQAETQPTADYTVFVHVLNTDGTCCAWQSDAMPRGGRLPDLALAARRGDHRPV
jgi:hypothetical protein